MMLDNLSQDPLSADPAPLDTEANPDDADGDFPIETDGGAADSSPQVHMPPPPPLAS